MTRPRLSRFFGVLLGILAYAAAVDAQSGTGSWVSIGPDGIGAILSLAIDPTATSTLYAGTDGGGVYKSTDGAATWVASLSGLADFSVFALAVGPAVPAIVYAGTPSGLFVSLDGGGQWTPVAGLPRTVFGSVVFDPANSSTIYAVSTDAGVHKSSDAGTSWTSINASLGGTNPSTVAIDPSSSSTLYVGTIQSGVYKSSNGGASWTPINNGLANLHVRSLAVNPAAPSTIYAGTTNGGAYKTTNGGSRWDPANTGLAGSSVAAFVIDPTNSLKV
jgi:hypothetical protein